MFGFELRVERKRQQRQQTTKNGFKLCVFQFVITAKGEREKKEHRKERKEKQTTTRKKAYDEREKEKNLRQ